MYAFSFAIVNFENFETLLYETMRIEFRLESIVFTKIYWDCYSTVTKSNKHIFKVGATVF